MDGPVENLRTAGGMASATIAWSSSSCSCPCSCSTSVASSGFVRGESSKGRSHSSFIGRRPKIRELTVQCHNSSGGRIRCGNPQQQQQQKKKRADATSVEGEKRQQMDGRSHEGEVVGGVRRRHAVLGSLMAAAAAAFPISFSPSPAHSLPGGPLDLMNDAPAPIAVLVDEINAYSYAYPVSEGKGSSGIRWVESRKPERYSSAAPLAPDARQRIVSERLNVPNNLVVSVSVGPPNFAFLKSNETSAWDPKDVARSVLTDKSTARMTTGQRVSEFSLLDAKTEEKDGILYWYYEYVVQKSPTLSERNADPIRHSIAVTAEREGYLYSLNASTSGKKWNTFEPMFKNSVESFRLKPPTPEYVPPYKDPWRFW